MFVTSHRGASEGADQEMKEDFMLNIGGRLVRFSRPQVMGILNATPDSFYKGSRCGGAASAEERARVMLGEGADMIDVGGCSTRPGAPDVSSDEEYRRLAEALEGVRKAAPDIIVSVDTWRASVARKCVEEWGVQIINDVSGGTLDPEMFATVADLKVPYVLMHMRGTPAEMQLMTDYSDVTAEVVEWLARHLAELRQLGVADVIVDPGFGFAKTVEQNFRLLGELEAFRQLDAPLLAGISRKSMIWKTLQCSPEESLNGTTVLNTIALQKGVQILRVHDAKAAAEAVRLTQLMKEATQED